MKNYVTHAFERHCTVDLGGAFLILKNLKNLTLVVKHNQDTCALDIDVNVYDCLNTAENFLSQNSLTIDTSQVLNGLISMSEIKQSIEPVDRNTFCKPITFLGSWFLDLGNSILYRDKGDDIYVIDPTGNKLFVLNLNEIGEDLSVLAKKILDIIDLKLITLEYFIAKLADWLN